MEFISIGYGGEYILKNLCVFLRHKNHTCYEVDMADADWRRNYSFFQFTDPPTLLSSHHPYLDKAAFRLHHRIDEDIEALNFFIRDLNIANSFWFPHDLIDMVRDDEFGFLSLFKCVFLPRNDIELKDKLNLFTRVESLGFVKHINPKRVTLLSQNNIIFLPSEIGFYGRNPDLFERRFRPLLKLQPDFKILKCIGSDYLENIAKSYGCFVHDSEIPASDLIDSASIVVTCGVSSIIAESHDLTTVICLKDGVHSEEYQNEILLRYKNAKLLNISDAVLYINNIESNYHFKYDSNKNCKVVDIVSIYNILTSR